MCGRGVHEKVYGELKSGFAFGSVVDLDQPEQGPCRRRALRASSVALLDEAAERRAAGTAAEPAPGRVAALGAREQDRRLRHATTLRPRADTLCANFVPG